MKLAVASAALLFAGAAFAEPQKTKTEVSSNQAYGVRFEKDGDNCKLVAVKDATEVWSLDKCVGTVDDFYFINNEGDRVWILHSLPQKPGPPAKGKKGMAWYAVAVAELIEKDGSFVRAEKLSDVCNAACRVKVQQLEKYYKWLEGALGVPGKGPRVNDKNQVEFEVAGGKTEKLGFDGPSR